MKNFEFKNPTKILFGEGQIAKVSSEVPADAKVLLLYGGGSIKKNGIYEQVMSALEGFDVEEQNSFQLQQSTMVMNRGTYSRSEFQR